jgi:hypothetical protein
VEPSCLFIFGCWLFKTFWLQVCFFLAPFVFTFAALGCIGRRRCRYTSVLAWSSRSSFFFLLGSVGAGGLNVFWIVMIEMEQTNSGETIFYKQTMTLDVPEYRCILVQRLDTLVNGSDTISQILPTFAILTTGNNKASIFNHIPPFRLTRELFNALDKILIAIPITSNDLANQRYGSKTPALVDKIKDWIIHLAKLQTSKDTTRLQDTKGFLERNMLVGEIAYAKRNRVQIYTGIRDHVQVLGIGLYEIQASGAVVDGGGGAFAAFGQHVRVDV